MRPLAGPAMMLVMVVGFAAYRLSSSDDAPPRKFLELELAGLDGDQAGSCYSLSTALMTSHPHAGEARTWTSTRDDEWTLLLEDVVQGNGGPVRAFQKFTFEKRDELVHLVSVEASKGLDSDLERNIHELVSMPKGRGSTPMDRCLPRR